MVGFLFRPDIEVPEMDGPKNLKKRALRERFDCAQRRPKRPFLFHCEDLIHISKEGVKTAGDDFSVMQRSC